MPAYRIYWLDQNDHIIGADYLLAETNDAVRAEAPSHLGTASAVEVWHRTRRVLRVDGPVGRAACLLALPTDAPR